MMNIKKGYAVLFLLLFALSSMKAQGIQTPYGKNRVQYQKFNWVQYESQNFIVYWYEEGKTLGEFVVQIAERDYEELQSLLEYKINDRIHVITYTDLNDLKQSNIGNESTFYNTGGVTRIIGNKIYVHFNGDRNNLRQQIREGITQVYLNHMMFGGNLQEIVQNAVLLNLPQWFTNGLVSYIGESWSTEKDNRLRDGFTSGRIQNFYDLVREDAQLAGHALWYYIGQNYGQSTVANLLYLTRINRSVESGFLYVIGNTFKQTTDSWFDYFGQRYVKDKETRVHPTEGKIITISNKKDLPITELALSPSGKQIAYVVNDLGKYKVILHQINEDRREVIVQGGLKNNFQIPENNYPLLAWSPNGQTLLVGVEKANRFKLIKYNVENKKKESINPEVDFQRVTGMNFISNTQLVLSVINRGQSDIVKMGISGGGIDFVVQDKYDDQHPSYVEIDGRKGIIFSSNRNGNYFADPDQKPGNEPLSFDLYFYPIEGNKTPVRITNTPMANESEVIQAGNNTYAFLSDESGIYNRYVGQIENQLAYTEQVVKFNNGTQIIIPEDSIYNGELTIDSTYLNQVYQWMGNNKINTNYTYNINEQSAVSRTGKIAELFIANGKYAVRVVDFDQEKIEEVKPTDYRKLLDAQDEFTGGAIEALDNTIQEMEMVEETEIDSTSTPNNETEDGKIDIDNYFFQSEFENDETPAAVIVEDENGDISLQSPTNMFPFEEVKFKPFDINVADVKPYKLRFKTDYLTTQLDNSLMFGGMDNFAFKENEYYEYPGLGIFFNGSIQDVMENYRFQGGIRVPISFNGVEYFLRFEDKKKRLDKSYSIYRKSKSNNLEPGTFNARTTRTITHIAEVELNYPLNIFSGIRVKPFIRTDRNVLLATDFQTFSVPKQDEQRLGLRAEFVYDNTSDISVNIKSGTRYKIFAEVQKRFDLNLLEEDQNFGLDFGKGMMTTLGLDARHYFRIDKFSILAGRLAVSSSFGAEKTLYFLGGVDNWIISESNTEIPVPQAGENFAFQTLASNLRGFKNNIRNGNSFAVVNLEARVPILNYFSKNPLKSSFLRNFQLIAFFDVGTAWQGLSPFSNDNPLNTVIVGSPNSPVSVKVNYFRNPIVSGFGAGMRAMLFGYLVRLDYAWGLETGILQDPTFYISLGKDF